MARIDTRRFDRRMQELEDLPEEMWQEAGNYFRDITPIDGGNARRNTHTVGNRIEANYPYAGALDDGHSDQAPNGMTEPTLEEIERIVDRETRRI